MKPISTKTLRDAAWKQVYAYQGLTSQFHTFACDALPGFTITHERKLAGRKPVGKVKTTYSVHGRRFDNSIAAVRFWNEQARTQATGSGGRPAPGSPKSLERSVEPGDHV